jgi:hypothetical protein
MSAPAIICANVPILLRGSYPRQLLSIVRSQGLEYSTSSSAPFPTYPTAIEIGRIVPATNFLRLELHQLSAIVIRLCDGA